MIIDRRKKSHEGVFSFTLMTCEVQKKEKKQNTIKALSFPGVLLVVVS